MSEPEREFWWIVIVITSVMCIAFAVSIVATLAGEARARRILKRKPPQERP